MSCSEKHFASLNLTDFSFKQIESRIKQTPSLILPVGGIEPVGDLLSLGAVNHLCDALAGTLSQNLQVMVAPLLAYGSTIPFKSFGGCAGVHHDILTNFVVDCCKCWFFHGIKRIMVLTLSMDAGRWGNEVVKRCTRFREPGTALRFFALQEERRFRSLCGSNGYGGESGRSEWGLTALAAYLCPEAIRKPVENRHPTTVEASDFKRWYRRGRDPEKLRKLAPSALFSGGDVLPDAASGEALFDATLQFLTEELSPFFAAEDNASR